MDNIQDTLWKFLEQFILLVIPVLLPFIVAWLTAKIRIAWNNVGEFSPSATQILEQAALFAVYAAEQSGISVVFQTKKRYAIELAQKYLKANKVNLDLLLIDAAIEKAVFESFHKSEEIKAGN